MTITISAAKFKAGCLQLMDEVAISHEEIIITKRGKPLVKLAPLEKPASTFGCMAGTITIPGDIMAPIDEEWDAMKE